MSIDITTELLAAIVTLRIAYLAIGFGLCMIGRSLIERGVNANFEGQGGITNVQFKVVTASPGLIFCVAGLAVIALAIFRQVELPVGPVQEASVARFNRGATPQAGSQVTLDSVRARLWIALQTASALQNRVDDASSELAQLDEARRKGDADSVGRLLVAAFQRNPAALFNLLKQTQPSDWPNVPGAFAPLRDELDHVIATP